MIPGVEPSPQDLYQTSFLAPVQQRDDSRTREQPMTNTRMIWTTLACTLLMAGPAASGSVEAQQEGVQTRETRNANDPGARIPQSIASINRDFENELRRLERQ